MNAHVIRRRHGLQAVRNEVVAADAAFLQREVERLTEELTDACSGAAEAAALRAELAAATAAGSHLAEELAAAESAVRATQARSVGAHCHERHSKALWQSVTGQMHPGHDQHVAPQTTPVSSAASAARERQGRHAELCFVVAADVLAPNAGASQHHEHWRMRFEHLRRVATALGHLDD